MIGIFDSGVGGMTILKEVSLRLPQYDYFYLGDNYRAPYGDRSPREILELTEKGIGKLFQEGANLIILACNTASAVALRKIQQEILAERRMFPKVLGIIVPTVEEVVKITKTKRIGILATSATVKSNYYREAFLKMSSEIEIFQTACPQLVPLIEKGREKTQQTKRILRGYLRELLGQNSQIDVLVLGCTHYWLIRGQIEKDLPLGITLFNQGKAVAEKLKKYLDNHPEIEKTLQKRGRKFFGATRVNSEIRKNFEKFWGGKIELKEISY